MHMKVYTYGAHLEKAAKVGFGRQRKQKKKKVTEKGKKSEA